MSGNKEKCRKVDPKIVAYIAGGAVVGGVVGYIINKVGFKNMAKMLKDKNIISPVIGDFMQNFDFKAFALKTKKDLEDAED
jgi:large-conductance mechanosensitive channel